MVTPALREPGTWKDAVENTALLLLKLALFIIAIKILY